MLTKNVLLYGKDESLPERMKLRSGPLSMIYENGDLRYIRYGDREVIRRIYVAIRDRNWGTVPPNFSNVQIDIGTNAFRISYDVENQEDEIDFVWHGEIVGESNGILRFSMNGIARSTFWRNRIGFCILHPAFLAGERCMIEHVDESCEEAQLPVMISADQPLKPFADLRAMTHEVIPGVRAETRYLGDIFEWKTSAIGQMLPSRHSALHSVSIIR
jgi:D-apionolactonase